MMRQKPQAYIQIHADNNNNKNNKNKPSLIKYIISCNHTRTYKYNAVDACNINKHYYTLFVM